MTGRRARAEYLAVTKKFARRFVMPATVIIETSHRYLVTALRRERIGLASESANSGRIK